MCYSKFDDYINWNLPTCHCTIHGVTDGTYSKAHPHIDVVEHILLPCHNVKCNCDIYIKVKLHTHRGEIEITLDAKIIIFNDNLDMLMENVKW